MDWQHWVRKLPNGGDGITGFTRQEWRQWVDMLYHLHKTAEPISACSENKHKCKRKRTEDVSPQAPTQRKKVRKFNIFSSTPAQGPPAQGHTALSKDIAPQTPPLYTPTLAQGPLALSRDVAPQTRRMCHRHLRKDHLRKAILRCRRTSHRRHRRFTPRTSHRRHRRFTHLPCQGTLHRRHRRYLRKDHLRKAMTLAMTRATR